MQCEDNASPGSHQEMLDHDKASDPFAFQGVACPLALSKDSRGSLGFFSLFIVRVVTRSDRESAPIPQSAPFPTPCGLGNQP